MEKSYGKVWINSKELKALIAKGLDRIGIALEWLEHEQPGCTDKYIASTSLHFRRSAAITAASDFVSVYRIYCWLDVLMRSRGNKPYPTLSEFVKDHFKTKVSGAAKEAAKYARKRVKARKEPLYTKVRKVRDHILPHEERSEDYVNGVKYRVIVYFGRNVK